MEHAPLTDATRAVQLYERAAAQHHIKAKRELGVHYLKSRTTYHHGTTLLADAVRIGADVPSMSILGRCALAENNLDAARSLLAPAAAAGDTKVRCSFLEQMVHPPPQSIESHTMLLGLIKTRPHV
jgi:TPR repeat protein